MIRKFKSPLTRSILVHSALILLVLTVIYFGSTSTQVMDSTITLENIQVTSKIKKAFHRAIHTIGIPHQEPVEADEKSPLDHPAEPQNANTADESGTAGGIAPTEMQKYFMEVVNRIHRTKQYPKEAQFNEQEGVVQVLMEIAPDGRIIRSELEKGTAYKSLNDAAISAVQKLGQLPPLPLKPNGIPTSRSILLHIPIHFKLR